MYKNPIKDMLRNRQPVLGCLINGPFPSLVEIAGLCGFHFVFIDAEHGPLSVRECEELVRAAEVRHLVPFIRTPENSPKTILRYLDIGAMGIIIPEINSKEEAEAAVRAAKFPPMGVRGLASSRAADYGLGKPTPEYIQDANREIMVIALIESREAIDHAEEILSAEGVDAFFIGTSDLSTSLGLFGQVNHPMVKAAFDKVLNLGLKMGKPIGVVARDGESPKKLLAQGISITFVNAYSLMRSGAQKFIADGLSK
ncbi:MAG: aldolase/citrate lyase family protein [Anaerolineales bacterium]|jgi:4-hydroxy-2-oxoheptanedioate aldolase